MKKNYVGKLGALALALTLISTGLMGSTLAKYASETVGTGTIAIAKWNVQMEAAGKTPTDNKFTFTLAETKNENNNVAKTAVAPGDSGSIAYEFTDADTQVAYTSKIVIDTSKLDADIQKVIKFYSDDKFNTAIPTDGLTKTVALADVGKGTNKGTIYWRWETATDSADTTLGGKTIDAAKTEFTITLSAEQTIATTPTP